LRRESGVELMKRRRKGKERSEDLIRFDDELDWS